MGCWRIIHSLEKLHWQKCREEVNGVNKMLKVTQAATNNAHNFAIKRGKLAARYGADYIAHAGHKKEEAGTLRVKLLQQIFSDAAWTMKLATVQAELKSCQASVQC